MEALAPTLSRPAGPLAPPLRPGGEPDARLPEARVRRLALVLEGSPDAVHRAAADLLRPGVRVTVALSR